MPSVTPHTMRRVRKLLEEVRAGLPVASEPVLEWCREASALLPLLGPRKPPKRIFAEPRRKDAKRAKAATRRERVGEIRAAVMARADGRCELCWTGINEGWPGELHHLESGSGRRRALEAASNTMWVHGLCHRAYHRDPASFALGVIRWANFYRYPVPSRFRGAAEAQP